MTATAEPGTAEAKPRRSGLSRFTRLGLGLVLPVVLAVLWEIIVHFKLASGRLVPPPSVIFATFLELWRAGELQRHILVTTQRVAAGFAIGVVTGTLIGAIAGYSALTRRMLDPTLQALRSIPSIAWVPLVHPVVRHLRRLQDHADRGRRVLSGLSRRDGRDHVGRSQAGRSRPRLPAVACCDGAPHFVAGGAAALRDRDPLRPWALAGCSLSPPNCSAPPRASATC